MAKVRITRAYKKFSNLNLLGKLRFIISCISNNPNFLSPTPSVDSLNLLADDLDNFISKAKNGGRLDKALLRDKRQVVLYNMEKLSSYIVLTAGNNRSIIESSGFTASRIRSTADPLQKPTELRLTDGVNTGELRLLFKRVKNAKSYMYQIAEGPLDENTKWVNFHGTQSKQSFTRLKSGVRYWVRVAAIGNKAQVVYSDAVNRIAQ